MVNFYSCYVADCKNKTVTVDDVAGKFIFVNADDLSRNTNVICKISYRVDSFNSISIYT